MVVLPETRFFSGSDRFSVMSDSRRRLDLAMVFPGQGSQSVGMLSELAEAFPVVKETFDTASDVLGYDLWLRSSEGPAELLN